MAALFLNAKYELCVQFFENLSQFRTFTQFLQCEFGMAFGITVTHNHIHIAADTFSPMRKPFSPWSPAADRPIAR